MPNVTAEQHFLFKHRYWILAFAAVLFLPPLSFLFQFTGDANFCGRWCPRMFFIWREHTTLATFLAGFAKAYMGVALVAGMLAVTLFLGRYWCSHLCPVGGIMELGGRLVPRFLKIDFSRIPAAPVRYGYLTVYLVAPIIGVGSLCCSYCNFAAVPRIFGAPFSGADLAYFLRTAGLVNLGLVLLLGFFAKGGRAYCNLFCPVGALDTIANRLGLRFGRRMRVASADCNGCGQCAEVCPTWAIRLDDVARVDQLSCMPCGICESACPEGAIAYEKSPK